MSEVPSPHQLLLESGPLYTWCAFDTVGIPVALGLNARAATARGYCRRRIDIVIEREQVEASEVRGWFPTGACNNVIAEFCPHANFFCNLDHLAAWRTVAGDPIGEVLELDRDPLADLAAQEWAHLVAEERSDGE